MRVGSILSAMILALAIAPASLAKDPPSYNKGLLLSMDASFCGSNEKGGKTVAGEILGTDAQHKSTQEVLCQEYTLQGERITYRIRPMDTKHPNLLPVGDTVQFRIHKDRIYVLDREGDSKEREYSVVSMRVRQDSKDVKDARNIP